MILQLYIDGRWTGLSSMELGNLTQVETSQAAGTLAFSLRSEIDVAAQFSKAEVVGLRGRDSDSDEWTVLFFGSLPDDPERSYTENSAIDSYKAVDVWEELDRIVYQLDDFVAEGFNKSHLILFRDPDGERMTTGEQIKAALDYAISRGVDVDYKASDFDDLSVYPPSDEQSDLTVAEVIKRCLRWQPSFYTYFIYDIDGSKLRFQASADEFVLEIPLSAAISRGFSAKKNDRMAIPGVIINYEIENQIIDGTTQEIQTDEAGDVDHQNVLVHTFQIDGSFIQNEEASITITTESIPSDYGTNLSFVQTFFPYVCTVHAWGAYPYSPTSATHSNYITGGYLDGYGVVSVPTEFRWYCRWVQTKGGGIHMNPGSLCSVSAGIDYLTYEWIDGWRSVTLNLTSSAAGTYEQSTPIIVAGEEVPSGVAAALFSALRYPLHSGTVRREVLSIGDLANARNNLHITGGLSELATMRAPVQHVQRDWINEYEAIKFGYPQQAGISSYVDLLRSNRIVNRPSRRTWRTE